MLNTIYKIPQKFEISKYYKHTGGGKMLHILCQTKTTMWGDTYIAECAGENSNSELQAVGKDKDNCANFIEITKEEWMTNFS